jgi:hypothetical protein
MQVKELPPTQVPIWGFFVMSFAIVTVMYSLVFVRSQYFKAILDQHRDEIRRIAELRDDQRLNVKYIAEYIWTEKFGWILTMICLLIIIIPIVPVWASSLGRTVKLVVTISVLLASLLLLFCFNGVDILEELGSFIPGFTYNEAVEMGDEE